MSPTQGILYVTMSPSPTLSSSDFHDWYNNEHGPTRLRLPFIQNGFRYHANDLPAPSPLNPSAQQTPEMPEWLAIYDISDISDLTKPQYTRLRLPEVKSQREKDVMAKIKVDRRLFDLVSSHESDKFQQLEKLAPEEKGKGAVMVAVSVTLNPSQKDELDRWYNEEHIDLLSKVPGWLRTRRFVTSSMSPEGQGKEDHELEYLALHEYAPANGLGGEEFKKATGTKWNDKIWGEVVREKRRRVWGWHYTFGAAPRELRFLGQETRFEDPDKKTTTWKEGEQGIIESYVGMRDGVEIPYRLEGPVEADDETPVILLSNSILVEWGIWDGFLKAFRESEIGKKYRILRYHTRGRKGNCGDRKIDLGVLSEDIITLLVTLRIPKVAAAIGVSLGGATVLNTGLKYSDRVGLFVSCDTSAKSPEGNKKTWSERIEVAEKEDAKDSNGETTVGEQLAELTVRRWFVKESYEDATLEKEIVRVKGMVQRNSLEGFRRSVQALWEYDLREEMKSYQGRGVFVVGGGDGVLPGTMKEMAKGLGRGTECLVIERAGHLPMVEKPKEFSDVVGRLL
jgi:pimeloyl-ACP methyl ester carboxylesterase